MSTDKPTRDEDFAANFAKAREASKMSQDDVASALSGLGYAVHPSAIGKIERGERRVTVGEAEALAAAVGRPLDDLLGKRWRREIEFNVQRVTAAAKEAERYLWKFRSAQWVLANVADSFLSELESDTRELVEESLTRSPDDLRDLVDGRRLEGLEANAEYFNAERDPYFHLFLGELEKSRKPTSDG